MAALAPITDVYNLHTYVHLIQAECSFPTQPQHHPYYKMWCRTWLTHPDKPNRIIIFHNNFPFHKKKSYHKFVKLGVLTIRIMDEARQTRHTLASLYYNENNVCQLFVTISSIIRRMSFHNTNIVAPCEAKQ